ncbi:hypothetical protein ACQEVB_09295 [Pseudonocardia sp. CA-107938]|uniref:hypothetical protein n=1 Tax=Pseudonocardia sp. CA-107938 TaxID=3240021 RepID=UPI003D93A4AA
MTVAAGPHLDPPMAPRIARAWLGDVVAVAVVLVAAVCGLLGCLFGFLGLAMTGGKEGEPFVVVGALLVAVALVAAVAEIGLLSGASWARVALPMCAGTAAGFVALGALTFGSAVAVAGLVVAVALGAAAVVLGPLSFPGTRRPGVAALVAVLLAHAFVAVRLPQVTDVLFRLIVAPSFAVLPVWSLVLTAVCTVLPLAGVVASLRGVRWAFLLVTAPCALQVLLASTYAGTGAIALWTALSVAAAATAPFLRPRPPR